MTDQKEKALIKKLFSIAEKQQKIIEKLSNKPPTGRGGDMLQQQQVDPIFEYLRRVVLAAAANCNFATTEVVVLPVGGSSGYPTEGVTMPTGYTVNVKGNFKDNAMRQKFIDTFKAQVKAQKPQIADNVSILLGN